MAAKDTIVTFTSRSLEEILETGGSQKWKLRESRARYAKYLVCARHKYGEYGGGPEEHKTGFLLGKISGIVPAESDPSRYLVQINKWAEIDATEIRRGLFTAEPSTCTIVAIATRHSTRLGSLTCAGHERCMAVNKLHKVHTAIVP